MAYNLGMALSGTLPPEVNNSTEAATVSDLIENPGVRYTMVTLHIIAIVLASMGNGFLIVFIARHWKQTHRNVTAILILNLAVCDFINAVCYQPMRLVDILVYHEENLMFCQVSGFFSSFFSGVGFMLMVAIAQERFLLICYPFKAKRFLTLRNTVIVMVCIWACVVICAIPIPIGFIFVLEVPLETGIARFCLVNVSAMDDFRGDIYFGCVFAMFFVAPLIVVTYSYVRIFKTLRHAFPGNKQNNSGALRMLQQRQSLAKVMLSTAIIFVVSQGPHWLTFLINMCGYEIKNNPIFTLLLVELLTMISPVMNPIVYSIRHSTVRKGITHSGGSIYSAIRQISLNRNSTMRSDAPLTSSLRDPEYDVNDKELSPILEDVNSLCDKQSKVLSMTSDERESSPVSDESSCDSEPEPHPLKQTIYSTNGNVLRYSVTSV